MSPQTVTSNANGYLDTHVYKMKSLGRFIAKRAIHLPLLVPFEKIGRLQSKEAAEAAECNEKHVDRRTQTKENRGIQVVDTSCGSRVEIPCGARRRAVVSFDPQQLS